MMMPAAKEDAPPDLYFLAAMPDVVHLGKSLKCSWSNWILWFKGTRSTLAILYNLRREGEPELRMKLKKLLTEESVRNKDRMAVDPILLLTTPELLDVLKSVDRVVYTIVPEKYRMWLSNRPGMYPHPLSVTCGPFGKLLVVDFDPLKNTSKLLLVRLHSPADVTVLVEDLQNAKSVAFTNGVAYCTEPSSKRIRFAAVERNVKLKVSTLKKKADLQTKLQEFHLSKEGTVPQLRERLKKHLDELQTSYTGTVNSIAGVSFERPSAVCALSDDILLVADDGSGCFKQVCLNFDGVGIQGTSTALATYPHPMSVVSVAFSKGNNCAFFTASGHLGGIFKLELSSRQVSTVLRNSETHTPERDIACVAVDEEGALYFTDRKSRQVWKLDSSGLSVHAGKGQQGAADGSALFAEFSQPYGICCEGRTQYITDASTGCVKLVTPLDGTTEFLTHLGDLYRNFGVHLKGQKSIDASLVDAKTCLQNITTYLKRCVSDVQQQLGTAKVTNGPEGTVSSKIIKSCELMLNSITQLLTALEVLNPDAADAINLQSLLTLVVESLHATTKIKHPAPSLLDYCRVFGKAMRESVKRITNWSAKYFTHQRSYYPVPEVAMDLCNIPKLNPIPVVSMDRADIVKMREWAREHGQCVRQRTVRQQTTKFSAGTLPLTAYSVELRQDPLDMSDMNVEDEEEEVLGDQEDLEESGEAEEYDSDSDLSLSGNEAEEDEDVGMYVVPNTLTTRHGRQIRAVVRLDL